ncbi:MAG: thiopurine S-methyltransferase [Cyanobacteria bacterium J06632_22]
MTTANYWQQKWETNNIAFHRSDANPALVEHFGSLSLDRGARIFLPLCGKTLDIHWLLAQGYRVAGAELVEMAIKQLFDELAMTPQIAELGAIKRYSADNIDIYVGDIFHLSQSVLGSVDGVYDRAAMVALPADVRERYAPHLMHLSGVAPQLLLTFEYDQRQMDGPPFAISREEVHRHYDQAYTLTLAASAEIPGGLKGKCAALQNVWRLQPTSG